MSRKPRKLRRPKTPSGRQPSATKKTRTWTPTTVLSLILTAVGALGAIELRPQMLVSPQEPIEKSQPFSVPFRIDNTGYLSVNIVDAFCYVNELKVGGVSVTNSSIHLPNWDNVNLDRSDGGTAVCNFLKGPIPQAADIVIVIDYKPFRWFPATAFRKYFRFKGSYIDNWQWVRSPSAGIEADADKHIDEHLSFIRGTKAR